MVIALPLQLFKTLCDMTEVEKTAKSKRCTKNCVAFGCSNVASLDLRTAGISFHSFPFSQPEVAKKWQRAMHRKDFKATKHSRVCSVHFTPESFDRTGQTVRIRAGAIPTIFDLPGHPKLLNGPTETCRNDGNGAATRLSKVNTSNAVASAVKASNTTSSSVKTANTSAGTVRTAAGTVGMTAGTVRTTIGTVRTAAGTVGMTAGTVGMTAGTVWTTIGTVRTAAGTVRTAAGTIGTAAGTVESAVGIVETVDGTARTAVGTVKTAAGTVGTADGTVGTADGTVGTADGTVRTAVAFASIAKAVKACAATSSADTHSSWDPVVACLPFGNDVTPASVASQAPGSSTVLLYSNTVSSQPSKLPTCAEHSYSLPSSTELKHQLEMAQAALVGCKSRLKTCQQKNRRLESKLRTLQHLVRNLIENELIAQEAADCVKSKFQFSKLIS